MGSSGGDGGDTETTLRYAPYIETQHSSFLNDIDSYVTSAIAQGSPAADYIDIEIDVAFFGAGYALGSFPSLYDMFGKFMAGLDIDALYDQIFEATVNSPEVNNLVSAEASLLSDDIEENAIPSMQTGMRDLNSVMSSSYIVAKSLIESTRVKMLAKFSADLKYKLTPIALSRWSEHLKWNSQVTSQYAEVLKFYLMAIMDMKDFNYSMHARDRMWSLEALEYQRAALGALQGATVQKTSGGQGGASQTQKALGGALSGAAAGAAFGPWGAAAGAAAGLAMAFL